MTAAKLNLPESLGFRNGTSSVHTSRTMMLEELSLLLDKVPADAAEDAYIAAITTENVLGKPTQTTRQLTAAKLGELYAMDPRLHPLSPAEALLAGRPCWPAHAGIPRRSSPRPPPVRETTPFSFRASPAGAAGHRPSRSPSI